jgi:hypothetical protein
LNTHPARVLGDLRLLAAQAGLAAEGQAEAFAVAQVRDEAVGVLAAQHCGIVAAARRLASKNALSSAPARRTKSTGCALRGHEGERSTSAMWSHKRSRSHRWEMQVRST